MTSWQYLSISLSLSPPSVCVCTHVYMYGVSTHCTLFPKAHVTVCAITIKERDNLVCTELIKQDCTFSYTHTPHQILHMGNNDF